MELICPSCEARYQVPGGSIGEKGRQVSCMNCGHSWHAYPPLVLGTGETGSGPSRGLNYQGPDGAPRPAPPSPVPAGMAAASEPAPASEPKLAGSSDSMERAAASRSEQLAEIREMLAEVQSEDRAAAALSPKTAQKPTAAPQGAIPLTASNAAVAAAAASDGPAIDPRISEAREREVQAMIRSEEEAFRDRAERLEKKPAKTKPTDVKKLERSHVRRHRRKQNAKAAGSGAFLTGLLLVVMVAAVMIALYLLHPQIIERMPGSEAALTEYVATIDSLRVTLAETFAGVRDWVSSRLDQNA